MFYTYVLQNPNGILYKGSTGNLTQRLNEHNLGEFAKYTKHKGPWALVYFENFDSRKEAMAREKFLKTGKGRDFIKQQIINANITRGRAIGSSQGS